MHATKLILSRAGILFLIFLTLSSCQPNSKPGKSGEENNSSSAQTVDSTNTLAPKAKKSPVRNVSFFLENSGSMNGYLNYNSEFKDVVNQITRSIELDNSIETFYINTEVYPSNKSLDDFLKTLNAQGIKGYGKQTTSDLNLMFSKAIERAKASGISILISDGIYSLEKVNEMEQLKGILKREKLATRNALIRAIRGTDFQTHIIKLESKFKGRYYTVDGNNFNINNEIRPYYVWIFGDGKEVQEILSIIKSRGLPGYQNSANFFIVPDKGLEYSILPNGPGKIGTFSRSDYETKVIHEIQDTDPARGEDSFGFNLMIDLDTWLPIDSEFLSDLDNYEVVSPQNSYSITRIEQADQFDSRTKTALKSLNLGSFKPSHNLYLKCEGRKRLGEIQINLKYVTPRWIESSSTFSDNEYNTKTMGFQILMEAFTEAYEVLNDTKYLATTNLKIDK